MTEPHPELDGFTDAIAFTPQAVSTAPTAGGVHVVIDSGGEVAYVGATKNLRERLRQHLHGDRQASVLHEQVGMFLDEEDHVASAQEIQGWLTLCTVRWQLTDDPRRLKAELARALSPRFNRAAEQPPTGTWWVNQGKSYDAERSAGIVFAGSGGAQVQHHINVGRMQAGDVVLHHRRGQLLAVGEVVVAEPAQMRPYGPGPERDEGLLTRVEYFPLISPIPLANLPERDGDEGPFDKNGAAKQGYLFPVEAGYADRVQDTFDDQWPFGSPWSSQPRHFWLFQANPKQWDLLEHLPNMPPGHVEDWTVTRHRTEMNPGDGVVLWQGGPSAGVYALARLAGQPQLHPTPAFRPESSGDHEHRVNLVIERHVLPPITRAQAQADPVLSELDVLRRPWGGTNFPITHDQWRAALSLAPLEPGVSKTVRWESLIHWAARFAESLDFDAEERQYKLEIRDRLLTARDALLTDEPDWSQLLRRAFGSPNNLTAWRTHAAFLDWVDAHREAARSALLTLWESEGDLAGAINSFCAALPKDVSGTGTQANLASFLAAARGIEQHPVYRVTAFTTAYGLTGWPHRAIVKTCGSILVRPRSRRAA